MGIIEELVSSIPEGGILAIIQKELESEGDRFGLLVLKHLLENENNVFLFLYEPLRTFMTNMENLGINVDEYLGENLMIFDVFGSMNKIERKIKGVYKLSGYLDDVVFVSKLKEWAIKTLKTTNIANFWFFTYLSSGICKLFSNPLLTYKLIWALREEILKGYRPKTIITYSQLECPILEETVYLASDIVLETRIINGKKVGIITKGPNENLIFELFKEV
ncbi:hypothetical protein [Pyrococcus horikoshii]|uniref:KaiC-like domain-containing protein n=2 Tax=Pyrococcus horikoshii TaxID=53953 RepID=O58060_PYRHO|nr:hypothetical protein [Pyrococcus horikoshii]BAA29396.1 219aa long hypothetical protein [Pyrococcus horikoshii OT3]HII61098.1 hypothetical protein [Pyrococcus horikoshii]